MSQLDTKYKTSEKSAVIAKVAADEMISRLQFVALQPKTVVEIGGTMDVLLKHYYPAADLITFDAADSLPLPNHSADILVANLVLPWHNDWKQVLEEWCRVLRPEGLLMMTTLGPDTLKEWTEKDAIQPYFVDMHNLGDGLLQAGFVDPILDVEQVILSYQHPQKMLDELRMTKMIKPNHPYNPQDGLQVTFEIVFGHAWGALPRDPGHTVNISLESLRRQVLTKL